MGVEKYQFVTISKKYCTLLKNSTYSQEDMGEPLINFAEHIIAAKERSPKLRFFFHAGETDWQGSSTDINIIDALLVWQEQAAFF